MKRKDMGTNYYLHQKPDCECCGRPFEPLHIGKSSAGWCFALHVVPEDGINTLDDWRRLWNSPGAFIRNEYKEAVPLEEMEKIITERKGPDIDWDERLWGDFYTRGEETFHLRNGSERGPNNLLRHHIGPHCAGHGEGTWDYILGEFS